MSRQQIYRDRVDYEHVDPRPVAHMGPVPPVKELTRELMSDPGWLVRQMKLRADDESEGFHVEPFEDDEDDWDDDEPEWFTGYELREMEPMTPPPADQSQAQRDPKDGQESEANRSPENERPPPPDSSDESPT